MSLDDDPAVPEHPASSGADEPLVQSAGDEPARGETRPGAPLAGQGERSNAADAPDALGGAGAGGDVEAPAASPLQSELPASETAAAARARERRDSRNMLPGRERRRSVFERLLVRLIATCGIVGIGVAIAAIMVSNKSQGWVVGLVVSIVSVVLAAILWSSRQL
jgi:hypothetical protein